MKKWKTTLGMFAAALALSGGTVSAAAESHIVLNYKDTGMGSTQVVAEGTTLVPLKSLSEALGYTLTWDQSSKTAKLVRPDREASFTAGSKSSKVNGAAVALTKTARILKGTVYVPLVSAVSALGGKTWYDKSNENINIVDEPRFTAAIVQGRAYWVSQKNGDVYYRASAAGKPALIGTLPLNASPYSHWLEIKQAVKGTDLLTLSDKHYAMFNDFSNSYQALIQNGVIVKQMDYQINVPSYQHAPQLTTAQLFMTDGLSLQYINKDGSLGKLYELEQITGQTGDFRVEYAADDVALVRSATTTRLYAIHIATGESTNLSDTLVSSDDRKEWDRADGTDIFYLSKMLVLTKREGKVMTFTYSPVPEGKEKTVRWTLGGK